MTPERHPPALTRPEDRLGIVIVTRNRIDTLEHTLSRLRELEAPYPVTVVDNASTDGTPEVLRRDHPHVNVVTLPHNLGGGARNYGVRQLKREFIAFADDDSWWAPGSLSKAIATFDQHPKLALIMTRVLAGPEQRVDPTCDIMSRSPLPRSTEIPGVPILGFLACCVVFRRKPFLDIGGFQERFRTGGEETIVAMDLASRSWHLAYVDSIVTHHHPAPRDNMRERYIEGICTDIWLACMRRRPRKIASVVAKQFRRAITRPEYRTGIARAYPRIPIVLRERQPLPHWLESQIELVEQED